MSGIPDDTRYEEAAPVPSRAVRAAAAGIAVPAFETRTAELLVTAAAILSVYIGSLVLLRQRIAAPSVEP